MIEICLAAGLLITPLGEAITLRWTHSIEKSVWEEDYRLQGNTLIVDSARVTSTGAGMEPPEGSILKNGAWHYTPKIPPLPSLQLRHSTYVAPYIICTKARCKTVPEWLPGLPEEAILSLEPCAEKSAQHQSDKKLVTMPE